MIACPFKAPVDQTIPISPSAALRCRRFEPRQGLAVSQGSMLACGDDSSQAWPFASFSQIVFLRKGKATLWLPDVGRRVVRAGEWIVISALNWPIRGRFSGEVDLLWLDCEEALWQSLTTPAELALHLRKACLACSQRQEAFFVCGRAGERAQALVEGMAALRGESPLDRLRLDAMALELLAVTLESLTLAEPAKPQPCLANEDERSLEAAAAYLEANLSESHSLAEISRRVHLNEFKLKRGFRDRYNTTVFGYLRQKRMQRARALLESGGRSVLQVAAEVGYSNASHFTRAFRQSFGVNPKEFARG